MIFFSVLYGLDKIISLAAQEIIQIQCTCTDVDVRLMHPPLVRALNEHQQVTSSARALDLNYFSRKKT